MTLVMMEQKMNTTHPQPTYSQPRGSSTKVYKVDPRGNVIETTTGLTIHAIGDTRVAKLFANQLNGGCGFRGFTPEFILR